MAHEHFGQNHRLGFRIKSHRRAAKDNSSQSDAHRQPKRLDMTAERLRQSLEKPIQPGEPVLFGARLVDFSISPSDEAFEIAARFRLGRKGANPGEIGRSAFVEIMKVANLFERHLISRVGLQLVQR